MFDNNFDPLTKLVDLEEGLQEIYNRVQFLSSSLATISLQQNQLADIIIRQQKKIDELERIVEQCL